MSSVNFLADEDLRYEILLAVRRLEPSIEFETVQERALDGETDPEILEVANERDWAIVSHDVNTMKGLAEWRDRIVYLPI